MSERRANGGIVKPMLTGRGSGPELLVPLDDGCFHPVIVCNKRSPHAAHHYDLPSYDGIGFCRGVPSDEKSFSETS